MFGWFSKRLIKNLENKTQDGFLKVGRDMESLGKWVKHLDARDKQLFVALSELREEVSFINDEIESLREGLALLSNQNNDKQLFKKLPVLNKHVPVQDIQKAVQTVVQTDNYYDILKRLSANERLLIFTLLNNDMKLSYEDLALLLGKDKSTIRGQINSIKQKTESLIEETLEKNGKKRVFISEEIKNKMHKYSKVRSEKVDKKR